MFDIFFIIAPLFTNLDITVILKEETNTNSKTKDYQKALNQKYVNFIGTK